MGCDHPQGCGARFDFSRTRDSSEDLGPIPCYRQKPADIKAQSYGDAQTELHVSAAEVAQLAGDDRATLGTGHPLHRQHDVVNQVLSISLSQHVAEEIPRLRIVVVFTRSVAVIPVGNRRFQGERRFFVPLIDRWASAAPNGRSEIRAEAVGCRLQADVRRFALADRASLCRYAYRIPQSTVPEL